MEPYQSQFNQAVDEQLSQAREALWRLRANGCLGMVMKFNVCPDGDDPVGLPDCYGHIRQYPGYLQDLCQVRCSLAGILSRMGLTLDGRVDHCGWVGLHLDEAAPTVELNSAELPWGLTARTTVLHPLARLKDAYGRA